MASNWYKTTLLINAYPRNSRKMYLYHSLELKRYSFFHQAKAKTHEGAMMPMLKYLVRLESPHRSAHHNAAMFMSPNATGATNV